MMNARRLTLVVLCGLGLAVAGGLAWRLHTLTPATVQASADAPPILGGPFHLVDQNGKTVDESVLKGRWSAVYFGYTYCPDVCPMTLQALDHAAGLMGARARDFQIVFISVDPNRDTPAQMKGYIDGQGLRAGTLGLTGTPDQVAAAARAYRVYVQKEGEGDDYAVSHSTAAYLMDPAGRFNRVLAYGMTPDQLAGQIVRAMHGDNAP